MATSWSTMESSAANEAAAWSASGYSMTFSIPMLPELRGHAGRWRGGGLRLVLPDHRPGTRRQRRGQFHPAHRLGVQRELDPPGTPTPRTRPQFVVVLAADRHHHAVRLRRRLQVRVVSRTSAIQRRQPRQLLPGQRLRRLRGRGRLRPGVGRPTPGRRRSSPTSRPRPTASTGSPPSPRSRASRSPSASGGWAQGPGNAGQPYYGGQRAGLRRRRSRPSSTTWRSWLVANHVAEATYFDYLSRRR